MSENWTAWLSRVADEFMINGGKLPAVLHEDCRGLEAVTDDALNEVRFCADWPGGRLETFRSLARSGATGTPREDG